MKPSPRKFNDEGALRSPTTGLAWAEWRLVAAGIVLAAVCGDTSAGVNLWTKASRGGQLHAIAASPSLPDVIWTVDFGDTLYESSDRGETWRSVTTADAVYWEWITNITLDPADTDTLFVTYDEGHYEGTVRTRNHGRTWVDLDFAADNGRQPLAINPQNHHVIYAIPFDSPEIWKSLDGGDNWQRLMEFGTDRAPRSIALDPVRPNNVYVGTAKGVYKSADAGLTWSAANTGFPGNGQQVIVHALKGHPQRRDVLWAATNQGMYKTTDGGGGWVRLDCGPRPLDVRDLVVAPSDPEILYAAAASGEIYKGRYGGSIWHVTSMQGAPTGSRITLQVDAVSPDTVYATVGTTGVVRSIDGGRTWNLVGRGFELWADQAVASPKHSGTVYALGDLVLKTRDAGSTWQVASGGLRAEGWLEKLIMHPRDNRVLYLSDMDEVFRSIDGGKNWTATARAWNKYVSPELLAVDPANSRRVLIDTWSEGALETLDAGDHWHQLSPDLSAAGSVSSIAFDERRSSVIYAGVSTDAESRLWISRDNGKSWGPFGPALSGRWWFNQVAPDPFDGNLFMIIAYGALFRWKPGDGSWTRVFPKTDRYESFSEVEFDPRVPGTVYVASRRCGVWRSRDGGLSWQPMSNGLYRDDEILWVESIAFDATRPVLYAATEDGVYVRTLAD
ncbi:MAG: hypothetical protein AB1714_04565 [Acidobacteriota bacterium]